MTVGPDTDDADRRDADDGGDAHAALIALRDTLAALDRLVSAGKERYDTEEPARLALQRLWIVAGECARRYAAAAAVDPGVEPWSSPWGFRNLLAHRLPSEISDERTWAETVADLPGYRVTVDEALSDRSDRRT